jgi:uncharacterized membrane protein
MTSGSLSFAAPEWFWPAAIIFLAGAFFIFRSYAGTSLPSRVRMAGIILKTIGLALLLSILLEPTWTTTRPREGANLFAIVADNSMGLEIRDAGETRTRAEILRELLTSNQSEWQGRLEELFLVRRYLFDSRLESARDFAELNFSGRESSIGGALKNVAERFQGQPLAGVLLITDGNATDLPDGFSGFEGLPPIYPVLLGKESPLADVALQNISVSQTVFEDAPVTLTAKLEVSGFPNERIRARVINQGKVLAEETLTTRKNKDELPLRFQLKPDQAGISFYEVRVSRLAEGTNTIEATLHNNSRMIVVDRGKGPHRILYMGGRPNWEYKFLNRAASEDPQLELVSLLRIARREPKFTFRGRSGESSNPLYRGFNKVNEETERYDQPVLVRLNTKDDVELRAGFPKTAEDLFGYEGIIFDDVEAEFFTADQMLLVQRYVSERGGGFLMLGGVDSLENGKYLRTPVGDMLPLYLDRLSDQKSGESFVFELTREGWLQPWVRLKTTEQEERERLQAAPPYQALNQLREIKPGASVLAIASDNLGNKFPAIAVQRFGNGRVGCVTIGDLWRSGITDEKAQAELGKSWRQMLRWLIADVPLQYEIRVEPAPESAVILNVRARDHKFQPFENATVQITVAALGPAGKTNFVTLAAEPADRESGVYRATYIPREPGAYVATAVITDMAGLKLSEVEAGWTAEPLAREFASLVPNRPLLEQIARSTGGEMIFPGGLTDFVQGLKKKKAPIIETYSYPLWHKSSVFLLALGCFISEWGLRRWKGLA